MNLNNVHYPREILNIQRIELSIQKQSFIGKTLKEKTNDYKLLSVNEYWPIGISSLIFSWPHKDKFWI